MARRILYSVEGGDGAILQEEDWDGVMRLQRWYNAEFFWTTGKLALKRYAVFPCSDDFADLSMPFAEVLARRQETLRRRGLSDLEVVHQLERDGLVSVRWGGYAEGSLASGFTRVANNEWNAYLVCDFLLKVSRMVPYVSIRVTDEGRFIRHRPVLFRAGDVVAEVDSLEEAESVLPAVLTRRIFAVVDPKRFERHPVFRNQIARFNSLDPDERAELVQNWNWLGFEEGPAQAPTGEAWNLNDKVGAMRIAIRS